MDQRDQRLDRLEQTVARIGKEIDTLRMAGAFHIKQRRTIIDGTLEVVGATTMGAVTTGALATGALTPGGNINLAAHSLTGVYVASLANNNAMSFTPGSSRGVLLLFPFHSGSLDIYGVVAYRTAVTAYVLGMLLATDVIIDAGAPRELVGTTSTDNKFTVGCHTDGKIYLENRLGTARTFGYQLIGGLP
jgi:hypothetical protein